MGVIAGLMRRQELEERSSLSGLAELWNLVGGGVSVTKESALTYSAVYAAIRVLAESVAMLPLLLYRKLPDGRKERATDHPLYEILHIQPNENMSSFQWRETGMLHLGTWGNFYNQIISNRKGEVLSLVPLDPEQMELMWEGGEVMYAYKRQPMPNEQILHVAGLGFDGVKGYSPIGQARKSLELAISMDKHGEALYRNSAQPGGVLEHPGKLGDKAYKNLKAAWEARHMGPDNAGKMAILEEGMQYKPIGFPPKDAQFIESRKFQIAEVARWFRVPLHMLAELDRATNNNIEHISLEFVMYTLQPWLVRWEQWMTIRLLTEKERKKGYFIQFLVDGLLRGDIASRYQAYATGRQNGWLSANDIRVLENMNPIDGGEVYLVPLNMVSADEVGKRGEDLRSKSEIASQQAARNDNEKRGREMAQGRYLLAARSKRLFRDAAERIMRRERNDVVGKMRKILGRFPRAEFLAWLSEFYQGHRSWAAEQVLALMLSYSELVTDEVEEEVGGTSAFREDVERFTRAYASAFGDKEANRSEAAIVGLLDEYENDLEAAEAIELEMDGWVDNRSIEAAQEEAVQLSNALAVTLYGLRGVERLLSVATGESTCPYCRALDGKVIGIREYFLMEGQGFQPEGADRPLSVGGSKRHSPYHKGCDCMTVAG